MNFFTTEDLLEYYYQETSPEKSREIILALKNNWAFQQKFDVICQAADHLDKSVHSPRAQSIQSILDHAVDVKCEM